jgi:hypothetical protein
MRQVNLYHYYHLGTRIHSLAYVNRGDDRFEYVVKAGGVVRLMQNILAAGSPETSGVFGDCAEEAQRLVDRLSSLGAQASRDPIAAFEATAITTLLRDFELAFNKSLSRRNVFEVQQQGIYDSRLLVDAADRMFTDDIRQRFPERTVTDWKAAGRCLAFELATASGFHSVRATEAVIHQYYVTVTGDHAMKRKDRNWGAYVRNLNRHRKLNADSKADPKLISLIDQIREHHRNVVIHPEEVLDQPAARALFSVCEGAIISLVQGTPVV